MVPYVVDAVVAVTVMHVLLFLLHVHVHAAKVTAMLVRGLGDVWLR